MLVKTTLHNVLEGVAAEKELRILRVSIARLAQSVNVELPDIKVLGKAFSELTQMAREQDRDWNALIAAVIDKWKASSLPLYEKENMPELQRIEDILVKRDGISEAEALHLVEEFRQELADIISDDAGASLTQTGASLTQIEEMLAEAFGLEPDYLYQVMPKDFLGG